MNYEFRNTSQKLAYVKSSNTIADNSISNENTTGRGSKMGLKTNVLVMMAEWVKEPAVWFDPLPGYLLGFVGSNPTGGMADLRTLVKLLNNCISKSTLELSELIKLWCFFKYLNCLNGDQN